MSEKIIQFTGFKGRQDESMDPSPHHDFDGTVVVTDIQIPFWSMVGLLFKFFLAAIPAFILLVSFGVFLFLLWDVLGLLRKVMAGL